MRIRGQQKPNGHLQWGPFMLISLTQERIAIIDVEDWPLISQYTWSAKRDGATWYAKTVIPDATSDTPKVGRRKRKNLLMHRLLLGLDATQVGDHADGQGLQNSRYNLRPATHLQNSANRRRQKNNTSGVKGVSWSERKRKWRASIARAGSRYEIGSFLTKEEAAEAYRKAAQREFGEFMRRTA